MLWLALLACTEGADPATLVDELRVVAVESDPAEAGPGEDLEITATVADPSATGAEVLVWHCTNLGDGCLEAELGVDYAWVAALEGDQVSATTTVPAALSAVLDTLGGEPFRGVLAWVLACEPGLCPQVDDPLAWDLADPTGWLVELPLQGVSLAMKPLVISDRLEDERLANPVLQPDFDEALVAAPGEEVTLPFTVTLSVAPTADSLAFPYATAGGFSETETSVGDDGAVTLTWYAPDESGEVVLYVVLNDGAGGVAVWIGRATVG